MGKKKEAPVKKPVAPLAWATTRVVSGMTVVPFTRMPLKEGVSAERLVLEAEPTINYDDFCALFDAAVLRVDYGKNEFLEIPAKELPQGIGPMGGPEPKKRVVKKKASGKPFHVSGIVCAELHWEKGKEPVFKSKTGVQVRLYLAGKKAALI